MEEKTGRRMWPSFLFSVTLWILFELSQTGRRYGKKFNGFELRLMLVWFSKNFTPPKCRVLSVLPFHKLHISFPQHPKK